MKLQTLFFTLLVTMLPACLRAQEDRPKWAIHFSNPLVIGHQARMKFECRIQPSHSLLLGYAQYYHAMGSITTSPFRYLAGVEYRYYRIQQYKGEGFGYATMLLGDEGVKGPVSNNSAILCLGIGVHGNRGIGKPFFIELNVGMRFRLVGEEYPFNNTILSLLVTPILNYLDFNFHFGWQHYKQRSWKRPRLRL